MNWDIILIGYVAFNCLATTFVVSVVIYDLATGNYKRLKKRQDE